MITPFILSGGKSRRMGTNKSFVRLGGRPLIEIVKEKVIEIFDKTPIIITNHFADYEYLGCDMVADIVKDKGPLGGIHAGLVSSPTPYIFVFACDMPFIEKAFVHYMLNRLGQEDILIPHNGESVEPLHAIYSKQCLGAIKAHLHEDRRCVQSFFQDVNIAYVNQNEMHRLNLLDCYFLNVNTVEDLQRAENCLKRVNL
ncbi:molybdenum cofactor guanylyltransferase [Sporomusa malonica]|uniref:Probable molybdenum cofactor guanylyltransferase n=1 Tax=Sporomusa malonica TaxID=112901 RepID=A0A1W2CEK6_9FIRM|nr:molybdenum cofactor guanylyltransferase [Sporomusa malonica]SMC83581.1 molybdopterin-guanine dinucleotide biosynthesis protein A [Sporomusa malonica]